MLLKRFSHVYNDEIRFAGSLALYDSKAESEPEAVCLLRSASLGRPIHLWSWKIMTIIFECQLLTLFFYR